MSQIITPERPKVVDTTPIRIQIGDAPFDVFPSPDIRNDPRAFVQHGALQLDALLQLVCACAHFVNCATREIDRQRTRIDELEQRLESP